MTRSHTAALLGCLGLLVAVAGCDKDKPVEPKKAVAKKTESVAKKTEPVEKKTEPVEKKTEPVEKKAEPKPPGVKPDYVKCDPARPEMPCTPDTPPPGLMEPGQPAKAEPWTDKALTELLTDDPHQSEGQAVGWAPDKGLMGLCTWTCASRNDPWVVSCFSGDGRGPGPGQLKPISREQWLAKGFLRFAAKEKHELGPHTLELPTELDEEEMVCKWQVRVSTKDGKTAVLGKGEGTCMEDLGSELFVSDDDKLVLIVNAYSGDHGCGDVEGLVIGVPEHLTKALDAKP